jgi:hypothetical protein
MTFCAYERDASKVHAALDGILASASLTFFGLHVRISFWPVHVGWYSAILHMTKLRRPFGRSENWIQDAAAVRTSPKSIHTIAILSGSEKVDLTYLDYETDLQYCQQGGGSCIHSPLLRLSSVERHQLKYLTICYEWFR